MPAARMLRRIAIVAASLIAASTFAAPVAHAGNDPATVRIGGLSSSLRIGRSDSFTVTLRNETDQQYLNVSRVFTVRLDGLTAEQVRITRSRAELPKVTSAIGEVSLADPLPVPLEPKGTNGSSRSWGYQLQFLDTVSGGRASVTFTAYAGATKLGSASVGITVPGSGASHSTMSIAPTASASPTALAISSEGTYSAAPLDPLPELGADPTGPGSGAPVMLYLLGAALLGVGGALIWLLLRRPAAGDTAPAHAYGPRPPIVRPPRYPAPATNPVLYPTAIMPAVDGPPGGPVNPAAYPGPASDPWAAPSAADVTRDFGRGPGPENSPRG